MDFVEVFHEKPFLTTFQTLRFIVDEIRLTAKIWTKFSKCSFARKETPGVWNREI